MARPEVDTSDHWSTTISTEHPYDEEHENVRRLAVIAHPGRRGSRRRCARRCLTAYNSPWGSGLTPGQLRPLLLVGGERAKTQPDSVKGWLAVHKDAVMVVLFLVMGVNLIAKGIPSLT